MSSESTSPMFLVVLAASLVAHVSVVAALSPAERVTPATPAPPALVAFEAAPPPPRIVPEPAPPPPAQELPARAAARPVARAPRPPAARIATRPTVTPAEPPPTTAPAEPVDFSGVTLTNEGAGWATPVGDGGPLTGPIGAPTAVVATPRAATRVTGGGTGDRVVAVGDLSRRPRAPNLDAQLAANYPHEARLAGLGGTAVIRVRILVDGRVGATRVVSESTPGFGKACQRTVAGSRWQPPLDATQQAVATDLAYTCTFAVAR